jgi:hypothetical protein
MHEVVSLYLVSWKVARSTKILVLIDSSTFLKICRVVHNSKEFTVYRKVVPLLPINIKGPKVLLLLSQSKFQARRSPLRAGYPHGALQTYQPDKSPARR